MEARKVFSQYQWISNNMDNLDFILAVLQLCVMNEIIYRNRDWIVYDDWKIAKISVFWLKRSLMLRKKSVVSLTESKVWPSVAVVCVVVFLGWIHTACFAFSGRSLHHSWVDLWSIVVTTDHTRMTGVREVHSSAWTRWTCLNCLFFPFPDFTSAVRAHLISARWTGSFTSLCF